MYDYVIEMNEHYRGNHLLVPMGGDFSYMEANKNFELMDNLIEYFNKKYENVKLLYSTPDTFVKALHA